MYVCVPCGQYPQRQMRAETVVAALWVLGPTLGPPSERAASA